MENGRRDGKAGRRDGRKEISPHQQGIGLLCRAVSRSGALPSPPCPSFSLQSVLLKHPHQNGDLGNRKNCVSRLSQRTLTDRSYIG
jgi:hypothetical protein